jgi:2-methylcitrate dehydratase PrpD
MAEQVPLTQHFAQFVANTEFSSISQKGLDNSKLFFLDILGAALASLSYPVGRIALNYCRRVGGSPDVTVWGTSVRSSLPMGAFTNGLLAHGIDFDDWEAILHSGHPSCMVIAPALAVGEANGVSGKEVLKAYAIGVEVYTRIASGAPNIRRRGFHGTPIFGTMGATAAAASLLQLNTDKVKMAFGIAASGASGIMRQHGTMCKPYHAGNAARNGVEAALLAESGFTSDEAIFENPLGFCDTLFGPGNCDYKKMIEKLASPFFIESPGLSFKPYPFSTPQFLAAECILHLVNNNNIKFDDVNKVELRVPQTRYEHHYIAKVKSGLQAKFAINYVTAIGVLEGKFEKESFSDEKINDRRVLEALGKLNVIVDPNISGEYEKEVCPITVELKNGKRFSHTTNVPKGHPDNPVGEAEVLVKFRDNVKQILSTDRAEQVISKVKGLDSLKNVSELTSLLTPDKQA